MNPKSRILALALVLILTTVLATCVIAQGPTQTQSELLTRIGKALKGLIEWQLRIFYWILLQNPKIFCFPEESGCRVTAGVDFIMPYFTQILVPFYIIAILFTGVYFVLMSSSPEGRGRSKVMLFKLLYSMILVVMAPILFQTLLDTSSLLTNWVNKTFNVTPALEHMVYNMSYGQAAAVFVFSLTAFWIIMYASLMALFRYILVIVLAIAFPVVLFLYFFEITRGYGRKWLKRILVWVYVPVIQMLLLVFSIMAITSMSGAKVTIDTSYGRIPEAVINWLANAGANVISNFLGLMIACGGLFLVVLAPLILDRAILWVGIGITTIGYLTNRSWIMATGELVRGGGPAAITTAVGRYRFGHAIESHRLALFYGMHGHAGRVLGRETAGLSERATGEEETGGPVRTGGGPAGGGGGGEVSGGGGGVAAETPRARAEETGLRLPDEYITPGNVIDEVRRLRLAGITPRTIENSPRYETLRLACLAHGINPEDPDRPMSYGPGTIGRALKVRRDSGLPAVPSEEENPALVRYMRGLPKTERTRLVSEAELMKEGVSEVAEEEREEFTAAKAERDRRWAAMKKREGEVPPRRAEKKVPETEKKIPQPKEEPKKPKKTDGK